jgi:hypothetical protein
MKTNRESKLGSVVLAVSLILGAGAATAGIGGSSIAAQAYGIDGSDIVAFGPIDAAAAGRPLQVLGQTVSLSSATVVTLNGRSVSANRAATLVANSGGSLVAVYGSVQANGTLAATQIDFSNEAWVPGTTTVFIRGVVTQVNPAVARAQVGKLSVDYSAGLYDPNVASTVKVGSTIDLVGTQFAAGKMYASTVGIGGSSANDIGGSSTAGIGGSSTAGIGGSSKSGIGGSSTAGIGGSSKSGIGGSSTAGIGGSSTAGIGGSSTAGIGGSSKSGIGGSSTAGIGGSSTAGIGGSSTAGIGGSSTAGIGGSSTAGIGGSSF